MTRVVVTGMGMVSPLGVGLSRNWKQLIANKSGLISTTTLPDYDQLDGTKSIKSSGKVPHGSILEGHWQVEDHIPASEARRMATFSHYALASAHEALQDARLLTEDNNALNMDTNKG